MQFENSEALCRWVAEQSDGKVVLSFSGGKDSLGAWLQLERFFPKDGITPVFCYLIPHLSFVDEALDYYEQFFGRKIYRMPHPSLYRMLGNAVYQTPQRAFRLNEYGIAKFDFDALFSVVKQHCGLPETIWTATGVRAADSPRRWVNIKQQGPANAERRTFFPVYDWRKQRLVNELEQAGCKLGMEYALFGRTFDGLDYRFLKPIADDYPEDYQRILEFFPMAELVLKKMEYRERYFAKSL